MFDIWQKIKAEGEFAIPVSDGRYAAVNFQNEAVNLENEAVRFLHGASGLPSRGV